MNLQELNQSGQHFWIFAVSAFLALTIAAFAWFLLEQINSVRMWWSENLLSQDFEHPADYSLGVRLTMLLLLVKYGRFRWMLKTKAWAYVLSNSKLKSTEAPGISHYKNRGYNNCSAGHSILHYIKSRHKIRVSSSDVVDKERRLQDLDVQILLVTWNY